MTCPCCDGSDVSGAEGVGAICWDCSGRFHKEGGATVVDDCTCGRHDEGKPFRLGGESASSDS